MSEFVHLHLHTQYSLLDGAIRLPELFQKAKEYKVPAVAITDHGNLFGAIDFYTQAMRAGIKPISGVEAYVAPGSRFDKTIKDLPDVAFHLVLLAMDKVGYENLIKLITSAHLEGFYYRPRIDKELLREHSEGLIALSACLRGEVPHYLVLGDMGRALRSAEEYKSIFGDRFYLEVQENGIKEQAIANQGLLQISRELDIPLVATGDCHYLRREESKAHDVLLCIQTGKTVNEQNRLRFQTDEFYFKSPEEMAGRFSWCPEAVKNTLSIAERCNLVLDFSGYHLPRVKVPEGHTLESYLEEVARSGLEERLDAAGIRREEGEKYYGRLKRELSTIKSMGLAGYFLIVADFINYAKSNGIPVGPGRGSAAGSLTAFSLRITDIDPISNNLLFERFLNEGRRSLPDIDVDFCLERRDEVIRYVAQKYGQDRVAQIITFGTMQAKAAIRDVGRALDMPYSKVDRIAKLVPPVLNITLAEALEMEPRLRELKEGDEGVRELLDLAQALEGLTRHASTHAAGVVISDLPLIHHTPLYRGPKGEILTQYDMNGLERIGLVKFDFLSLKTLTVIDKALRLLRESRGIQLDLYRLPQDDEKTFQMLSSGDADGVFQLEGRGMRDLMIKLKPEKVDDIAALIALYRPGPLQSGMVEDFIQRKHGNIPIEYEIPQLQEILKETYGVIVYQEQVMKIASELAGLTPEEADRLRYAMGKKDPEEMKRQKELFVRGARRNGITLRKAERIFDLIAHFAGYGFNKSHSAAYAVISYQTAYLKAHYPVEFMAALLSCDADNSDKVLRYIGECRHKGIPVLPPDINESSWDFTVVGDKIRFGLAAIKNVGRAAIDVILEAREAGGKFSSFSDFCRRIDLRKVNRRVLESLIKAGAFDSSEPSRSALLEGLKDIMDEAQSHQRQISLFSLGAQGPKMERERTDPPELRLAYEREALGLFLSDHPLRTHLEGLRGITTTSIAELIEGADGREVVVAGIVGDLRLKYTRQKHTKKRQLMAIFHLEDMEGRVEVVVFPNLYRKAGHVLEVNRPVVVTGVVESKDEGVTLRASKLSPLSPMKGKGVGVHIFIKEGGLDRAILNSLKSILNRYKGDSPTFVHLLTSDKEAIIKLEVRVNPSPALMEELKPLLGDGAVELEDGIPI